MRTAIEDPNLLGRLMPGPSWRNWRTLLIAMQGEELAPDERDIFARLTGGRDYEPGTPCDEVAAIVGRRGGKTVAASVLATYRAACCDYADELTAIGERGVCAFIASSTRQASIAFSRTVAAFDRVPMLRRMIVGRTADTLRLSNRVDLRVLAASYRAARGDTLVACVADEVAFWPVDSATDNIDVEILRAVRPALHGPLILISTPFAKRGELHTIWRKNYGPEGDPRVLVVQGDTRTFYPDYSQSKIDAAYARDPVSARCEYGATFREDSGSFLERALVEAAVDRGVVVRQPQTDRFSYRSGADPSGGRGDAFTAAVTHMEGDVVVLDCIMYYPSPCNVIEAAHQIAKVLKAYRITTVRGDDYGADWVKRTFAGHGIYYSHPGFDRSEAYLECLPLFTAGRIRLIDNPALVTEFCDLERTVTTGRDKVHRPLRSGGRDDLANSVAIAAVIAAAQVGQELTFAPPPNMRGPGAFGLDHPDHYHGGPRQPHPDNPHAAGGLTQTEMEIFGLSGPGGSSGIPFWKPPKGY